MGTLRFQLFGFPISVLPGYWLLSGLLGFWMAGQSVQFGLVLMGCVFVSVLVHELGHAMAARAYGLPAQITFHMMGGATSFPPGTRLGRGTDVLISLAGPLAGLALGGLAWAMLHIYSPVPVSDQELSRAPSAFLVTLEALALINISWSLLNLVPVIPLDGGRILAASLGPRRQPVAGAISLLVGLSAAMLLWRAGMVFAAVIFGAAALSSFFRLREVAGGGVAGEPDDATRRADEGALKQSLAVAEKALERESFDQASQLAHAVMSKTRDQDTVRRAIEVFMWARLGAGDPDNAHTLLAVTPAHAVDRYVAAAVLEASGDLELARKTLSEARARGDARVEVTALLIKVLLQQNKFSAAANLTRDILGQSSAEDVRRVATEASKGGAIVESARLSLALAKLERSFIDAKQALLGFAASGERTEALEAFKLARGFDRQQSLELLEDERLQPFKNDLEAAV